MPINYSKWDALELSDDSDIEVHPNVDKRSFIRAKQNQIHQKRYDRKFRIKTLRYEKVINDGLIERIDGLLDALGKHRSDLTSGSGKDADDVDEAVFDALVESGEGKSDVPPPAPEGVHTHEQQQQGMRWSKMMGALVDQVKAEVNKSAPASVGTGGDGEDKASQRFEAYNKEITTHKTRVQDLQQQLHQELAELEKEESGKITSESIHTGFNTSHVSKDAPTPVAVDAPKSKAKSTAAKPELLNASSSSSIRPVLPSRDSGAEADIEDGPDPDNPALTHSNINISDDDDDADMIASSTAKQFGRIPFGNYGASMQFISQHPAILKESETDGLLVEAFNAQSLAAEGGSRQDAEYARQCVHQALLLQYCRQLGRDGVRMFFQRVQTPGHQARKLFLDDVGSTYARIRERTAVLAKQKHDEGGAEGVETIQLHAVDPGTSINISIPPPVSGQKPDDATGEEWEGMQQARAIFEAFSQDLRRALESGSLDKVNEVLGCMAVEEAELVVEKLSEGGMLSVEEGIIDATTDDGKRLVEEYERNRKMGGGASSGGGMMDDVEDDGEAERDDGEGSMSLAVDEVD